MKKKILKIIYKLLNKIPEDVNDDGIVNSKDLLTVKKYLIKQNKESDNNGILE